MKKLSLLLVIIIACTLVFCSCGKDETPYDYDLGEYVVMGTFPKVEIDMDEIQKEVDDAIEEITVKYAEKKDVTDRPVQDGDVVNIDYVGKVDGKEFEGGSAKATELTIGSDTFIEGFEDGLIGKNAKETVELNLKFPDDYRSKELQGKEAVFTVTINSIQTQTIPELTDKMVEEKTDYKTVSEFLEFTRKDIVEQHILENYIDSCKMTKYPQSEVKKYYDQLLSSYSQMAIYNGMTLEDMVTSYYGYKTLDEFLSYAMESAMLTVKEEVVIWKTVRDNDIPLTEEEYEKLGAEIAEESGYTDLKEYEDYIGKNTVKLQIYMDKITDMVYKANDIKFDDNTEETEAETEASTEAATN